jgi:hypothetical protein
MHAPDIVADAERVEERCWLMAAAEEARDEARYLVGFSNRLGSFVPGKKRRNHEEEMRFRKLFLDPSWVPSLKERRCSREEEMRFSIRSKLLLEPAWIPQECKFKFSDEERNFLLKWLSEKPVMSKRGRSCTEARDDLLVHIMVRLVNWFGLVPTRNPSSAPELGIPTASEIVAAALGEVGVNVSARTIERLWSKRPKQPQQLDHYQHLPIRWKMPSWAREQDEARLEQAELRQALANLARQGRKEEFTALLDHISIAEAFDSVGGK